MAILRQRPSHPRASAVAESGKRDMYMSVLSSSLRHLRTAWYFITGHASYHDDHDALLHLAADLVVDPIATGLPHCGNAKRCRCPLREERGTAKYKISAARKCGPHPPKSGSRQWICAEVWSSGLRMLVALLNARKASKIYIYIYIQLVHPSRTFYSRIQKNLSRGCHILPCFSFPSICSPMFSQCSFSKLHGRHSAGHFPHLTGPVNPMAGIPIAKKHYTAVIPPKHTYHHWWSCILYIYITVIGHSEIGNR